MQQHILDDRIGAFAMLNDFFEIILQQPCQFLDFASHVLAKARGFKQLVQLIGQFRRDCGEVVDEVQRVLDLVGDARRELAE